MKKAQGAAQCDWESRSRGCLYVIAWAEWLYPWDHAACPKVSVQSGCLDWLRPVHRVVDVGPLGLAFCSFLTNLTKLDFDDALAWDSALELSEIAQQSFHR